MATFIFTWNPEGGGYPPREYNRDVRATAAGQSVRSSWSVGSRRRGMNPGDRAFLLRQATERGIVASGTLVDGVIRRGDHWDPKHTHTDAYYAVVEWDRVVATEFRLPIEDLPTVAPTFHWSRVQGSGQEVRPPDDVTLTRAWGLHLDTIARRATLPDWTWDETVLAWDLYLRDYAAPPRYADARHRAVITLSGLLRSLPLHPEEVRANPRFRNPEGVARKLQNLMWVATAGRQGSSNGSATDRRVVTTLQDSTEVSEIASAIQRAVDEDTETLTDLSAPDDAGSVEGRLLEQRHQRRERDRTLVRRKKEQVLKAGKPLTCEVCDVDVAVRYELSPGALIECHHRLPLASGERRTTLADLAVVCPTCHRALHSGSRWRTVEELRACLSQQNRIG